MRRQNPIRTRGFALMKGPLEDAEGHPTASPVLPNLQEVVRSKMADVPISSVTGKPMARSEAPAARSWSALRPSQEDQT